MPFPVEGSRNRFYNRFKDTTYKTLNTRVEETKNKKTKKEGTGTSQHRQSQKEEIKETKKIERKREKGKEQEDIIILLPWTEA